MDEKKSRSSIKRTGALRDDDNTVIDIASRQRRRISFSGKKSIREFCREEEPKTWNNSYEVDHTTSSEDGTTSAASTKEQCIPVSILERTAYATTEYCDKTLQNNTLHFEYSVDIPLLDHERKQKSRLNDFNPQTLDNPSISFSVYENEVEKLNLKSPLTAERTVDLVSELHSIHCAKEHKCADNVEQRGKKNISIDEYKTEPRDINDTSNISDEILDDLRQEGRSIPEGSLSFFMSKTLQQTQDMDISLINVEQKYVDKENVIPSNFIAHIQTKTDNSKIQMEFPIQKVPEKVLSGLESTNEMEACESFNKTFKRVTLHAESDESNNLQIELRDFYHNTFEEETREMSMEICSNNSTHIKDNPTKTIIFDDDVECDYNKITNENFLPDEWRITHNKANSTQKIDSSFGNRRIIENLVTPKCTNSNTSEVVSNFLKSDTTPKVVVCPPYMHKQSDMPELKIRRYNPYKEGWKINNGQNIVMDTSKWKHKYNKSLDFSSPDSNQGSLSQELSSPLVPNEFLVCYNRNQNLRQLNDDIEQGKFQIYKDQNAFRQTEAAYVEVNMQLPNNSLNRQNLKEKFCELGKVENNSKKREFRYFEADDMLLDNTSFLTQARLGDETQSRNNSKTLYIDKKLKIHHFEKGTGNMLDVINNKLSCIHSESILSQSGKYEVQENVNHNNEDMRKVEMKLNDTNENIHEDIQKQDNMINAPVRSMNECTRRNFEVTPRRSIIEFELLEQQCEQNNKATVALADGKNTKQINSIRQTTYGLEDIGVDISGLNLLENRKAFSTANCNLDVNETKKQLTANLSLTLPSPKRRQTEVWEDCNLEESFIIKPKKYEPNVAENNKDKILCGQQTIIFPANISIDEANAGEVEYTCVYTGENNSIDSSGIELSIKYPESNVNKSLECTNLIASRIPVLISSANKFNSGISCLLSPKKLNETHANHSLETIEIPRRIAPIPLQSYIGQQLISANKERALNKGQGSISVFEDNPVTISDVSVHYLSQKHHTNLTKGIEIVIDKTMNESVVISNFKSNKSCALQSNRSPEGCDDNTVNNIARFNKHFINLDCDSSLSETRISLVETLLDDENECELEVAENIDRLRRQLEERDTSALVSRIYSNPNGSSLRSVSLCRKCKRCQTFLGDNSDISIDSFVLPKKQNFPSIGMDRLRLLRQRSSIADVEEYYRRKSLEKSYNIINQPNFYSDREDINGDKESEDDDFLINSYKKRMERIENELVQHLPPIVVRESYVKFLEKRIRENSNNWIFDYQLQYKNILKFYHQQIQTCFIEIQFDENTPLNYDIDIKDITLQSSHVPKKNWRPIDFLLDFQLRLHLPFDLRTLSSNEEEVKVLNILEAIDKICCEVVRIGCDLWRIVCSEQGTLIRDTNRTYIIKMIRNVISSDDEYSRVENCKFRIEVTNIRKLCFKDIVTPPLHWFSEEIQFLPTGLDFLQSFLSTPTNFLKN